MYQAGMVEDSLLGVSRIWYTGRKQRNSSRCSRLTYVFFSSFVSFFSFFLFLLSLLNPQAPVMSLPSNFLFSLAILLLPDSCRFVRRRIYSPLGADWVIGLFINCSVQCNVVHEFFLLSVLTVLCSPMWKENNLKDSVTSKLLILHFIHQSSPEKSSSGRLIGSLHSLCVLTSHRVVMLAEQTYGWWGDYESRIRLFMND